MELKRVIKDNKSRVLTGCGRPLSEVQKLHELFRQKIFEGGVGFIPRLVGVARALRIFV